MERKTKLIIGASILGLAALVTDCKSCFKETMETGNPLKAYSDNLRFKKHKEEPVFELPKLSELPSLPSLPDAGTTTVKKNSEPKENGNPLRFKYIKEMPDGRSVYEHIIVHSEPTLTHVAKDFDRYDVIHGDKYRPQHYSDMGVDENGDPLPNPNKIHDGEKIFVYATHKEIKIIKKDEITIAEPKQDTPQPKTTPDLGVPSEPGYEVRLHLPGCDVRRGDPLGRIYNKLIFEAFKAYTEKVQDTGTRGTLRVEYALGDDGKLRGLDVRVIQRSSSSNFVPSTTNFAPFGQELSDFLSQREYKEGIQVEGVCDQYIATWNFKIGK